MAARILALTALALHLAHLECSADDVQFVRQLQRSLAASENSPETEAVLVANWVSGPFGDCSSFCNVSLRTSTVECRSPSDGRVLDESSCSAGLKPPSFQLCSCDLVACSSTAMDCDAANEEFLPDEEFRPVVTEYTVIGCFQHVSMEDAMTCPDDARAELDDWCIGWNDTSRCRSGLPFYRNCAATTVRSCSEFCLHKNMDIMAIFEGQVCRCGASLLNSQVWQWHEPPQILAFDAGGLQAAPPKTCPLLVGRYPGHFHAGGLPNDGRQVYLVDTAYVDSIVLQHVVTPMDEEHPHPAADGAPTVEQYPHHEHIPGVPEVPIPQKQVASEVSGSPMWGRHCWPGHCGPANGPWPARQSTAPAGVTDNFQEYVIVKYAWNDGTANGAVQAVDDTRKEAFRQAVTAWHSDTCVVLEETTEPTGHHIEVGVYEPDNCFVLGVGVGYSRINLGWCNSATYLGTIIHEIGHALGMNHEMKRADAQQAYHGYGPFLDVHWENIPQDIIAQYSTDEQSYIGSAHDGPGDPHVGYASYDFDSIMHYPASDTFDTFPESSKSRTGQRSGLSAGDITQTLDQYQCRSKSSPSLRYAPVPTTLRIGGLCDSMSFLAGDYTLVGNTHSGAPFYRKDIYWLYHDPECSGANTHPAFWVLDNSQPSTSLESDLDEDGTCVFYGWALNTYPGLPPLGPHLWTLYCNSSWVTDFVTLIATDTVTTTTTATITATLSSTTSTATSTSATTTTASTATSTATTSSATTSTSTSLTTTATSTSTSSTSTTATSTATSTTKSATSSTVSATTTTTVSATSSTISVTDTTVTSTTSATTTTSTVTATTGTTTTTDTSTQSTITITFSTVSATTTTTSTATSVTTITSTTASTTTTTTASTTSTTSMTSTTSTATTTTSTATMTLTTTTRSTTTTTSATTASTTSTSSETSSSTTRTTSATTTSTTSTSSQTSSSTTRTTSATTTSITTSFTRTGGAVTGDEPAALVLAREAQAEEKALLSEILSGDKDSLLKKVGNLTVAAFRLSATGDFVAVVDGTGVKVVVPASVLSALGVDNAVLLVTVFDAKSSASMGSAGGGVDVKATVSINLYDLSGDPLSVTDLAEPITITLPSDVGTLESMRCAYWDEAGAAWITDGLQLNPQALAEGFFVCETRHLTLFAAIERTYVCSQLKLLSAEGLKGLGRSGWSSSPAAWSFWGLLAAFVFLLAVAALLDWQRQRGHRWTDKDFLVALNSEASNDAEGGHKGKRGCFEVACAIVATCVLLDVFSEILSSWCELFAQWWNFLRSLPQGVQLVCGGRGAVIMYHVMARIVDSSVRRQTSASLRMSQKTSYFFLEAKEATDMLVSHRSSKKAMDEVAEDAADDHSNAAADGGSKPSKWRADVDDCLGVQSEGAPMLTLGTSQHFHPGDDLLGRKSDFRPSSHWRRASQTGRPSVCDPSESEVLPGGSEDRPGTDEYVPEGGESSWQEDDPDELFAAIPGDFALEEGVDVRDESAERRESYWEEGVPEEFAEDFPGEPCCDSPKHAARSLTEELTLQVDCRRTRSRPAFDPFHRAPAEEPTSPTDHSHLSSASADEALFEAQEDSNQLDEASEKDPSDLVDQPHSVRVDDFDFEELSVESEPSVADHGDWERRQSTIHCRSSRHSAFASTFEDAMRLEAVLVFDQNAAEDQLIPGGNALQPPAPRLTYVDQQAADEFDFGEHRRKSQESVRLLHQTVAQHLDRHLLNSTKWLSLPGSVWRLFLWRNPIGSCLLRCVFLASTLRVVLFMVDVVGALMFCTVFFQALGPLSRRVRASEGDCKAPESATWQLGRLFAIGLGAIIISVLPAIALASLSTRKVRTFPCKGCPTWQKQLRIWRTQDMLICVFALAYLGFSTFFIVLFLANVSEADQDAWIKSGAISIVLNTIVLPFFISLIVPLLAATSLSVESAVRNVSKRELINERRLKIQRKHANLSLPLIYV